MLEIITDEAKIKHIFKSFGGKNAKLGCHKLNIENTTSNDGHKKINLNVLLPHTKHKVDMSSVLPVKAESISCSV